MADIQCTITLTGNVTLAPKLCHVPDDSLRQDYPDLNDVPVNSYTCPVGQASGRAWVLLHRADLDVLTTTNKAGDKDATYTLGMKAFFQDVDEFLTIPNLVLVKAVRLNVGAPEDANALYLVELADKRFILETWADSGVIQANIRSHAQDDDYLTGTTGAGSAMTWDELIEAVWNKMAHILGGYSSSITSDSVPEGWDIRGENAWSVLHSILGKLGRTIAYNPLASTYSIVNLSASGQTIPGSYDKHLLRDAEPIEHNATLAPETIRVYFRTHYKSYGQERDTEIATNWQVEGSKASTSKSIPTNISGAVSGSVLQLWDDLPLVLDEDNSEDNDSDLTTRASAVASAWLADAGIERSMKTYAGFKSDVLPGGTIKVIRWQNLNAGPMTLITERSGFASAADVRGTDLSSILGSQEELQTPDLSRGSFPNFPRLPNIVEVDVTDGSPSTGDAVSPNGDGLFPGSVQRWVGGSIATLEECWIRPVDLEPGTGASESTVVDLRQNDKYHGRLSGIETSGGSTRPIYLVRSGSKETGLFSGTVQVRTFGTGASAWARGSEDAAAFGGIGGWDAVYVKKDGAGSDIPVKLPLLGRQFPDTRGIPAPNLRAGDVIYFSFNEEGDAVCMSDYAQSPLNTIVMWDTVGSTTDTDVPFGWQRHTIMDGRIPIGVDSGQSSDPDIAELHTDETGDNTGAGGGGSTVGNFQHDHPDATHTTSDHGITNHTISAHTDSGAASPGLDHDSQNHVGGAAPGLTHSDQTHSELSHTASSGSDFDTDDPNGQYDNHTAADIGDHEMSDSGQDHTVADHNNTKHTIANHAGLTHSGSGSPGLGHDTGNHVIAAINHYMPLWTLFFIIRIHE